MAVQDVIVASVPVADKEREGVLPRKPGFELSREADSVPRCGGSWWRPRGTSTLTPAAWLQSIPPAPAGAGARSDHFPSCPTPRTLAPIARGAVSRRSLDSRLNAGLPALNASRASGLGGER